MHRNSILEALRAYFAGREDVVADYLFGSFARNEEHAGSDVDVGVVFAGRDQPGLARHAVSLDIQADLEEQLGHAVDVVAMNGAPPDLLHRVLRDGVVVQERDPEAHVLFEVQSRNEYFDLQPILELYRRTVLGNA